jgi:hypothetical protein
MPSTLADVTREAVTATPQQHVTKRLSQIPNMDQTKLFCCYQAAITSSLLPLCAAVLRFSTSQLKQNKTNVKHELLLVFNIGNTNTV